MSRRFAGPTVLITVMVALVLPGCHTLAPPVPEVKVAPTAPSVSTDKVTAPEDRLAVFSAQLEGVKKAATESTPKSTSGATGITGITGITGTGNLVAVFNPDTSLFRWKLWHSGLKGIPKAGQFHGRDGPDTGGTSYLPFSGAVKSHMEGRATLTDSQAADLLAGRWYVSIRTSVYPNGEIRGQLVLHE